MSDNNEAAKKSKFNFGTLISINADGADANLNLTEFNAGLSLAIFANKRLALSINIDQPLYTIFKKMLVDLKKATNGSKTPLLINKWDRDPNGKGGKWVKDKTIIFGRTDDGIFFLEIKDANNAPFKFLFKSGLKYQIGSDPSDDATRSALALESFYNIWTTAHQVYLLAKLNHVPFKRNGGNSYGGNNNRPGNSGPSTKELEDDSSF